MDYIYGKLNFEIKKVEYKGTATETATTTVVTSEEANEISVDVLKVPNALNILDKNDETTTTFDGSEDKSITIHSYSMLKTLVPAEENQAEYSLTKDGEPIGDKIIFSKTVLNVSWSDLKTLCDSSQLVPGQQYRITDYECTTAQVDTQSAGHQFDIIVVADSVNKLNENARAIQRDGDTYFSNSNLSAWKLMYCLDNDTTRFAWSDSVNGKGVIYRMIDEFENDVPYDFKNIQFKKSNVWYYTFADDITGSSYNNKIGVYISSNKATLNAITFDINCYSNTFGYNCYSNKFGNTCQSNTFGNNCYSNTFDNLCRNNTFGNYCYNNKFGSSWGNAHFGATCSSNTFGNECSNNTFGHGCYSNTFGDECKNNSFGSGFKSNTFGDKCESNTFNTDCSSNIFGNNCSSNTFGRFYSYNTFGNYCYNNTFGDRCSFNTFGNGCWYNIFGNYCESNTFGNDCDYLQISDVSSSEKKNIYVENGTRGASNANKFDLYDPAILGKDYQVTFKKSASGKYLMLWATDTGTMTGKVKDSNIDTTWEDII